MDYLKPFPPMPAIREAMAKAAELTDKGIRVYDFSSGSVGNLLLESGLFDKVSFEPKKDLPESLKIVAEGIKAGLESSFYPVPRGLSYSPTTGTPEQKRRVIRYFREIHGAPLNDSDLDMVACTAGGQQAMAASLRSIKQGTLVLIPQWEYSEVPGIIKDNNCDLERVGLNEDLSLNMEDLKTKVKNSSVFYMSMPNNPSGWVSAEGLKAVCDIVIDKKGGVIWDAPYLYTVYKLDPPEDPRRVVYDRDVAKNIREKFRKIVQDNFENMCILSSLSKTALIAGMRFGFAASSGQWIANIEAIIGRENLSAPTPSFITGAEMINRFLEKQVTHEWMCNVLASRMTSLIEGGVPLLLPKNGLYGALYALVRVHEDGKSFAGKLAEKGIITTAGPAFYGGSVNAIRLSLVSVPYTDGDRLWLEAVKTLAGSLKP